MKKCHKPEQACHCSPCHCSLKQPMDFTCNKNGNGIYTIKPNNFVREIINHGVIFAPQENLEDDLLYQAKQFDVPCEAALLGTYTAGNIAEVSVTFGKTSSVDPRLCKDWRYSYLIKARVYDRALVNDYNNELKLLHLMQALYTKNFILR